MSLHIFLLRNKVPGDIIFGFYKYSEAMSDYEETGFGLCLLLFGISIGIKRR